MNDLTARSSHFEFGDNWLSFIETVGESRVEQAVHGLERLFPNGELQGRRLLDIGCGSGLNMLAALRLGAREVVGVDIDENSVEASRQLLRRFAPDGSWRTRCASVFDISPDQMGRFDIVYSWGVLHHTGDMWRAVKDAAALVGVDGLLAIALYRKTMFCDFWRVEKRFYAAMPAVVQAPIRWIFEIAKLGRRVVSGDNPITYVREYQRGRGMSWTHDVHDWLGGYPYESALADEVGDQLSVLGLEIVREYGPRKRGIGLLGSGGCNEYVARRRRAEAKLKDKADILGD